MCQEDAQGVLIAFTDGDTMDLEDLQQAIQTWKKQMIILGFGIGDDLDLQEYIEDCFDKNGKTISEVTSLPRALAKILKQQTSRMAIVSSQ